MHDNSQKYKDAIRAAALFAKAHGMRPLIGVFEKFGISRIRDIAPVNLPAFIAACWVDTPKLRRVK